MSAIFSGASNGSLQTATSRSLSGLAVRAATDPNANANAILGSSRNTAFAAARAAVEAFMSGV
jgi:hypothetical protein